MEMEQVLWFEYRYLLYMQHQANVHNCDVYQIFFLFELICQAKFHGPFEYILTALFKIVSAGRIKKCNKR